MNSKKIANDSIIVILIIALVTVLVLLVFSTIGISGIANADSFVIKDTGIYAIRNKATGYYLKVDYNNNSTIQWTKDFADNQRFILKKINNDWMIFVDNDIETRVLDVNGASQDNNASIIVWKCSNANNQIFRFQGNGDNSFRILTGSSNFEKCIGIEYNSRTPGSRCVQMDQNNDTTSWYLEELWGFSYVGNSYRVNENYPSAKYDNTFGTPTLTNEKVIKGSRMSAQSVFGTIKSETCDMYLYRYWRYSVPVNVRVYDFGVNVSLNPMQTYTYSITKSQSTTKTKSESISFGLEQSKSSTIGAGLNLEVFSLDFNDKYNFTANIKTQFTYSESNTYSIEEKEQISVTMPENAQNQPYYYKLEMRATMYLYYVQVFFFVDDRAESKSGIWTNYNYTRIGSICTDEQFHWELLPATKGLNPYKLDVNNGQYIYCGMKDNGVIYA